MGVKYTELGQVTTSKSDPTKTELYLRVEGFTTFEVSAEWSLPELEDKVVGSEKDLQVGLHSLGVGMLRDNQTEGFPIYSIATEEDALWAMDGIKSELDGLTEQRGKLSSNLSRVEFALDASSKQLLAQENALNQISGNDVARDMSQLKNFNFQREMNAMLMVQAKGIHQDVVNLLI